MTTDAPVIYIVDSLTPRESEVFALVVRCKLNKQIAHYDSANRL